MVFPVITRATSRVVAFVVVASAALTLACCLVVVMGHVRVGEAERREARDYVVAPPGRGVGYVFENLFINGNRTGWIVNLSDLATGVRPPGVSVVPDAGQAVVSPALDELCREGPASCPVGGDIIGTITPVGLANPGELLAYVGATRDELSTASGIAGFGSEISLRSRSFAPDLAVLVFAVLPLLLAAMMTTRAGARTSYRTVTTLRILGMSRLRAVAAVQLPLVAAAGVGAMSGGAVYVLAVSRLSRIPYVDRPLASSDLSLGWAPVLAGVLVSWSAMVAVAFIGTWSGVRGERGLVRRSRVPWGPASSAVMVVAIVMIVAALVTYDPARSTGVSMWLRVGLVLFATSVTTGASPLLVVMGRRLRRSGSMAVEMAGGRLVDDPVSVGRFASPWAAVSFIAIVSLSVSAFYEPVFGHRSAEAAVQPFVTRTFSGQPRVPERLSDGVVVAIEIVDVFSPDGSPAGRGFVANCDEIGSFLGGAIEGCRPNAVLGLDVEGIGPSDDRSVAVARGGPLREVSATTPVLNVPGVLALDGRPIFLVPPAWAVESGAEPQALAGLVRGDTTSIDELHATVLRTDSLGSIEVTRPEFDADGGMFRWLAFATAFAAVLLLTTLGVAAVDQRDRRRRQEALLHAAGAPGRLVKNVALIAALSATFPAIVLGGGLGVLASAAYTGGFSSIASVPSVVGVLVGCGVAALLPQYIAWRRPLTPGQIAAALRAE